jgi:type VI secretion system secreted protein VgrG
MAQTDLHFSFEPACNSAEDASEHMAFDVVEFTLTEALNTPFVLEVELLSAVPSVDFSKLMDQPVLFTIWQGSTAVRYVHGLISNFSQRDTGFRRTRYFAVVEPALTRTQLGSDWRIFQQKTIPEVISEVFKSVQISNYSLTAEQMHLQREYCVQAGNETDFEFLQRAIAEEGFVYRFEHNERGHQLLLTDVVQTLGALQSGTVLYQPKPAGDRPQPALRTFTYQEKVRTARQTQRDYTFKNPRYNQQQVSVGRDMPTQSTAYERYDYPGRYKQDAAGEPFTYTRLRSLRKDERVAIVQGDDARIQPGIAFELTGHPRRDLNTMWRPVRVEHRGKQHTSAEEEAATAQASTSYEQIAELVLATADWRAFVPVRPHLFGPEIAHIVGPEGEEIYTDEFGRVKVQFPWDRVGQYNEHSTCWIRVAQNWAGAGWGHIAIPRIGQEVIVDFLDGDPDQPIITGRAYDASHPTPYKLPALKTQQTVKSKEHKGGGYNELLIDDTTGEIKTQLHSTHGVTQLTMGYLTHPRKDDGSGEHRGDGFEVRTDEWGAIRAGTRVQNSTHRTILENFYREAMIVSGNSRRLTFRFGTETRDREIFFDEGGTFGARQTLSFSSQTNMTASEAIRRIHPDVWDYWVSAMQTLDLTYSKIGSAWRPHIGSTYHRYSVALDFNDTRGMLTVPNPNYHSGSPPGSPNAQPEIEEEITITFRRDLAATDVRQDCNPSTALSANSSTAPTARDKRITLSKNILNHVATGKLGGQLGWTGGPWTLNYNQVGITNNTTRFITTDNTHKHHIHLTVGTEQV